MNYKSPGHFRQYATSIFMLLMAPDSIASGQVGTTSDGNIIYHFDCPGTYPHWVHHPEINWPNHISWLGLEWHIGSEPHHLPIGDPAAHHDGATHSGQKIICKYRVYLGGERTSIVFDYKYKVHRHIVSCLGSDGQASINCILEPSGGQSSSSSIESAEPEVGEESEMEPEETPKKCIGLGCESQPNPSKCIGMGCDEKRPNTGKTLPESNEMREEQ